jgi:EAL domain-containing protein (putative c-di-GMP-specific phosphodiesterase class I)
MAVHIDLHINLSAQSLLSERLLDAIRAEMQGLPSWEGRLVLELTETSPLGDLEEERRRMLQLKALGCRLAMDDFGVGYSTCHRLLHLPLDMVKLDGSLVRGLGSLEAQRVVVASMVQAVKALGLLVVAEQVEDQETLEALRLLGVDYAQGYHIGRPRPVEEEWPGP